MQESLLHYIWQFQYFDKTELKTSAGEHVTVFHPGFRNTHAGPDFSHARIKIGDLEWIGNVEIHIHASGWKHHRHDHDAAYDNVVLHVVWKDDAPVTRKDQTSLPTVELNGRVDEGLLLKYNNIFLNPETIPCAASITAVNPLITLSMVEKALMTRLEAKSEIVMRMLSDSGNDWQEVSYQLLCRNFGFKVNTEPFLCLAKNLPYKVIMKHGDQLNQVEALLFGQSGLLDEPIEDDYFKILHREYHVLGQKFSLFPRKLNKAQWRFLRLRPANFPTVRMAQLAGILHAQKNIFSRFVEATSSRELLQVLSAEQSDYWKKHYVFGKESDEFVPGLGKSSMENIIVNTVVPLMVAWGRSKDDQSFVDTAVEILQQIGAEDNIITKKWGHLGLRPKNAFDSQAMIELHNNYCQRRRCLDCAIGASLIRPSNP